MADFVAVLRKTLDGLGDPSPETRQRVYERARATVLAKLQAVSPAPPQSITDRQMRALEDAITVVERGYAPEPKRNDPLDELEDVFASLNGLKDRATIPPRTAPLARPAMPPAEQRPVPQPLRQPVEAPAPATRTEAVDDDDLDVRATRDSRMDDLDADVPAGETREFEPPMVERPRRGFGRVIATLVVLAALAGAGYGAWLNKDDLTRLVGLKPPADAVSKPLQTEPSPPAQATAPAQPAAAKPEPAADPAGAASKLTQKLNADGSENDPGPAKGQPAVGEGTSVAGATVPSAPAQPEQPSTDTADTETPAPPTGGAGEPTGATPPVTAPPAGTDPATPDLDAQAKANVPPADPAAPAPGTPSAQPSDTNAAVALAPSANAPTASQKAIFYEERTGASQGSAVPGATVWSVVQDSPGGDRPPEPAIRAEATIPGKDVQLRMTIRRNADPTLPASHIVEMIFLTPENFDGGGVDTASRMALKASEQDAGNLLSGLPAKISDGFFLLALNNNKPEIDRNMQLLNREKWIDIPIVYKNGRRALITMEKGAPGEKVFNEVLTAWGIKTGD